VRQQINLYQPIFRKQQIIFSAQTLVWLALGFAVLLLLWSFLVSQRVSSLEAEHQRQLAAEQRAITQMTELRRNLPPAEPSADLENRLQNLNRHRNELRASLAALDRRQPATEARLHERFDALARRLPAGLWLTELRAGEQDGSLEIHGRALSAHLVPGFLQALSAEPLIAGTRFRQVRVTESKNEMPGVSFYISTRAEDES